MEDDHHTLVVLKKRTSQMQEKVYTFIKANAKSLMIAVVTVIAILALSATSVKFNLESNDLRLSLELSR